MHRGLLCSAAMGAYITSSKCTSSLILHPSLIFADVMLRNQCAVCLPIPSDPTASGGMAPTSMRVLAALRGLWELAVVVREHLLPQLRENRLHRVCSPPVAQDWEVLGVHLRRMLRGGGQP